MKTRQLNTFVFVAVIALLVLLASEDAVAIRYRRCYTGAVS